MNPDTLQKPGRRTWRLNLFSFSCPHSNSRKLESLSKGKEWTEKEIGKDRDSREVTEGKAADSEWIPSLTHLPPLSPTCHLSLPIPSLPSSCLPGMRFQELTGGWNDRGRTGRMDFLVSHYLPLPHVTFIHILKSFILVTFYFSFPYLPYHPFSSFITFPFLF